MPHDAKLKFIDNQASFSLDDPNTYNYLYFPLANEAGMMSSITPSLGGDSKTDQNAFLLTPVSAEDLHASRSTRNFWVYKNGEAWSATGMSAQQISRRHTKEESSKLEAGFLWHRISRQNIRVGLKSEIVTFVPCEEDTVELSKMTITNLSSQDAEIIVTSAIPIYARSADNIRDHRHVTSLLHRIVTQEYGVKVTPTLSFNERGHSINNTAYAILGADGSGNPPVGFFSDVEGFIGEGGTFDWPEAVVSNLPAAATAGSQTDGYEAMGALRFPAVKLHSGEKAVFVFALCINPHGIEQKYLDEKKFDFYFDRNQAYWGNKLNVNFHTFDPDFDRWMKWVSCEPMLRRIYGCSFLPHHDYGKGGRGWRDLWQDCIALLMMDPEKVEKMLSNNCAGIRFDGTNATIIGAKEGEFLADRNHITRVWMDHGAWPLNTIAFYIAQSGNLDFLLQEQTYFKDRQIHRGKSEDHLWNTSDGTFLLCEGSQIYTGTIIEHLLIENLTACLNVGQHGMLRLENADWNDALDMASENGESVAFSSMYCGNLKILASLLGKIKEKKGITSLLLAKELELLLDDTPDEISPLNMQKRLSEFCDSCVHEISGIKLSFDIDKIIHSLEHKAERLSQCIVKNECVTSAEGYTWLNGYYDNDGAAVEGEINGSVRMTLAGQVFAIMFGIADEKLTSEIMRAADRYLLDSSNGGYRLNTDFHELKTNLGRQFGFAYGHKENGAVFSHMTVMFANALYKRGFAHEGYKVIDTLCRHCMNFNSSHIYPGIPEYINPRGRGMYHYLTGAASWLILTYVTEIFGIKGDYGDLAFSPKLLNSQFDKSGNASCETEFGGKKFRVIYHNPYRLDYGEYDISSMKLDGNNSTSAEGYFGLTAHEILALDAKHIHIVELLLERGNHS